MFLALALTIGGCAVQQKHEEPPEVSAERIGDLSEHGSILEALDPNERDALARMDGSPATPDAPPAASAQESTSDKVGKAGISVLTVAISLGAAVAPFLLF